MSVEGYADGSAPSTSSAAHISIDDALSGSIGNFGRAQRLAFSLISLPWVPGAFLTLSMTFVGAQELACAPTVRTPSDQRRRAGKDPVLLRLWECADATDVACAAALTAAGDPSALFCELDASRWRWTVPLDSIVSDFGLQCGGEWKVRG